MKRFVINTVLIAIIFSCTEKGFLPDSDKNVLFAPPSQSEIDQIQSDWQKRNLQPKAYRLVQENQLLDGKFTFKIVEYTVANQQEYGALLVPKTDHRIPVRMLLGGFGLGVTTNSVSLVIDTALSNRPFILAIPALRGQSLAITINGSLYSSPVSEGDQCDAFDGATDDTIAFLNVIQQTENTADVNRTAVRGGSRGGTVALLAGIRDKRIKRVVGVVCPTNMVELTAMNENDVTYQCQFLNAVKNKPSSLGDTRNKLIASSPIYFAKNLPLTQLHMGLQDQIVPINQGRNLEQKMTELGLNSTLELYTYDRSHSDIASNNSELSDRIEQFLSGL